MNNVHIIQGNKARVTFKELGAPGFFEALGKIYAANLSPKVAYRVKKIGDAVDAEFRQGRQLFTEIVTKYGEKDEAGKLKTKDGIPGTFVIPVDLEAAFQKDQAELLEIAVTLQWDRLYLEELDGVQLSARDIAVLEPLLLLPDGGKDEKSSQKENS